MTLQGDDVSQTIADLGEQGLLALLQSFCPAALVGDDAALLTPEPGYLLVVTTDVLVDEVHFSDRTTPPHSVGWRAAAANLSDLAAMGAMPLGLTVGLSLPPDCPVSWVQEVYRGMDNCLERHGGSASQGIVGGDVCRSSVRSLAITALGQVKPEYKIQRGTAQPGDAVVVSGGHGGSRAGLELLLNPPAETLSAPYLDLVDKHRYPQPRLDCVPFLNQLSQSVTVSGMDSSDGLADAVLQICRASGVGATLWAHRMLMHWTVPQPHPARPTDVEQALDWTLYGGEDFELVLTMPRMAAWEFCRSFPQAWTIGEIRAASEQAERQVEVLDQSVGKVMRSLSLEQGFQHF